MNQVLSFSMESNKSRRGHVTTLEHCHMVALGSFLKGTQKPWVGLPTSKQHFLNMQPALLPGVPEVTGVTNEVYINWSSLTCVLRFSYLFHNSKGQGESVTLGHHAHREELRVCTVASYPCHGPVGLRDAWPCILNQQS